MKEKEQEMNMKNGNNRLTMRKDILEHVRSVKNQDLIGICAKFHIYLHKILYIKNFKIVLFSQNFTDVKFLENQTIVKCLRMF